MTGNRDMKTIELIFFDGCPHAAQARDNLKEALREAEANGSPEPGEG